MAYPGGPPPAGYPGGPPPAGYPGGPPPAGYPDGPPPPGGYPGGPPPPDQGYPLQPYPQPYMQGYHYPPGPGQTEGGGKNPYPPGPYPYPAPGQYPPGQQPGYPPAGQSGYPPGQALPPGSYPPGPYQQQNTAYVGGAYGQPTGSVVVTQPSGATMVIAQTHPPDNMILSVLACLFCFCPVGLLAVLYSWKAKCANDTNDFSSAMRYGSNAKKFAIASIVIGAIFLVIIIIVRLVAYTTHAAYSY